MSSLTRHELASSSLPVGVECIYCMRRAMFMPAELRAKQGDRRTLVQAGVRCGRCGSLQFSVERMLAVSQWAASVV